MYRILRCPIATLTLVLAVSACTVAHDEQQDIDQIRALIEHATEINNLGNVDAWVDLFDDDPVYMPAGIPAVTTRDGLREIATAGFSSWRSDIQIVPEEIVVADEWAFARARVSGTSSPIAGGDPVTVDLKELIVFHRQPDGSWKVARLIANSNG